MTIRARPGGVTMKAGLVLAAALAMSAPIDSRAVEALVPADLAPAALAVDAQPNGSSSNGNRVLEPGESVIVAPSWLNRTVSPLTATSLASVFTGPGLAALYTINDASASYVFPAGQAASCAS